jgi:hypothetical protein
MKAKKKYPKAPDIIDYPSMKRHKYGVFLADEKQHILTRDMTDLRVISEVMAVRQGLKLISFYTDVLEADVEDHERIGRLLKVTHGKNSYSDAYDKRVKPKIQYVYIKNGIDAVLNLVQFYINPITPEIKGYLFGNLCGIPVCCIKKHIDSHCKTAEQTEDYLKQLKGKKDPYNHQIFDSHIVRDFLFYTPCSPSCEHTKIIYHDMKDIWKRMFQQYGVSEYLYKKLKRRFE